MLMNTTSPAVRKSRRPLCALGAAALAVPLMLSSPAAFAAPMTAPPAEAITAIKSSALLADFQEEYLASVNAENIWNNDYKLSHEIGPRLRGTAAELEAVNWVSSVFESYGLQTAVEEFPINAQRYADVVPSRYTDEFASWQFRPANNTPLTTVSGEVVDIGNTTTDLAAREDLSGKIVLADWPVEKSVRDSLLTDLHAAGAAAVVLTKTEGISSPQALPNPGSAHAVAAEMVVVGSAENQGKRIRTLLADGPLSLTITTGVGEAVSRNAIGVLPAANGDPDAPIIYLGAHIDSVLGSPGASDNGSGVSILLEIARIMSEHSYDAEIRFGAWGAEESGYQGSNHHVKTVMTEDEQKRTLGAWNMDMAGTSYEGNPGQPFEFWALTADTNRAPLEPWESPVLDFSNEVSLIAGQGELPIGTVSRSDHQPFHDVGIKAAVFSWMHWAGGTNIILEPAYHQTTDTLEFVSAERMGHAARILGGGAFRAALHNVDVVVTDADRTPVADVQVAMSCSGDEGWRQLGVTDAQGLAANVVPHTSCDLVALADNGDRAMLAGAEFDGDHVIEMPLVPDTAPMVEVVPAAEPAASGWYTNSPVAVAIEASDDFDEVELVEYSWDGVNWETYTDPVSLGEEGANTLFARATDVFGHVSVPETYLLNIDSVVPKLSAKPGDTRGAFSGTATDATSGIAVLQYRVGDGAWSDVEDVVLSNDGSLANFTLELEDLGSQSATVQIRAVDVAGNASELYSYTISAAPASTTGSGLAKTGASSPNMTGGLALGALLLLGAGGVLGLRQLRRGTEVADEA